MPKKIKIKLTEPTKQMPGKSTPKVDPLNPDKRTNPKKK